LILKKFKKFFKMFFKHFILLLSYGRFHCYNKFNEAPVTSLLLA